MATGESTRPIVSSSVLFTWYIANFGHYNATYGSLGAAIGMMTWIWISMIVVLVGAQLNAEVERQATEGSTKGAEHQLSRGGVLRDDLIGSRRRSNPT